MAIKEFLRKLNFEVKRREDAGVFALLEFYFPEAMSKEIDDEEDELMVGETYTSITGKLQPES